LIAYSPHSKTKLVANLGRGFANAEKNGPPAVIRRFGC